jgi:streptogramin lyase
MIPRRPFRAALFLAVLAVISGLFTTAHAAAPAGRPDPFPSEVGPERPDTGRRTIAPDPITNLGAPISSLTVMEGTVGRTPDGRDVVYAVPAGENANLNVVDVHSRQLLNTVPLPGAAGAWGIAIASDGRLYVGTYPNAHLYRFDPVTAVVTDLGQPIAAESFIYGLTADQNGNVYGGTYPNAHAFKYDASTSQVTDYGSLDPVQQYARSTVYDPDHNALFVGISTPVGKILRIDLGTGTTQNVTPPSLVATDIVDLDYAGGRVFANASGKLAVIDAVTFEQVKFTDTATGTLVLTYPLAARGVSNAGPGGVYFTTATTLNLMRYDLDANTVGTVTTPPTRMTRGAAIGYGWVTENGQQILYGLTGNYSGGTFRYDPVARTLAQWSSPFQYVPVALQHVIADPASTRVYVNAYLNGSTSYYDTATSKATVTARQGQVEGWNWGTGSKMWVGIYPYGRLQLWDTALPESTVNPKIIFSLVDSDHQNRPFDVVPSGDKVYVATTPGYGEYGGAITVYDVPSNTFKVYRNPVTDQSIATLLPVGDSLWAGSAIEGGQGTEPKATEAHLVQVDPTTGTVTADVVPVPGAASINELTIGPDGNLWGLADGNVFVANKTTGAILRTYTVFSGRITGHDGALSWRDGYLYGVSGGRLFVLDGLSGTSTILRDHGLNRLTQGPDGTYYSLLRLDGWTIPTNLASYRPPVDPCPKSDLRTNVWTGNINSHVLNRHLEYGCTLADKLPDAKAHWPSHAAYVIAVDRALRPLEASGQVEYWEGILIRFAAAISNVGR